MGKPGSSRGPDYMRGFLWGLKGEEVVMANLNRELEKIKVKSVRGMVLAAAFIRNKTETDAPVTPVDFGNLRDSWFVVSADRVEKGANTPGFKGPNASKMMSEHGAVINEVQGTVQAQSTGTKKVIIMGYSANYSGFVHEMIGANFNPDKRKGKARRREGAGPKWLETHIKNNTGKIVEIIRDESKVK